MRTVLATAIRYVGYLAPDGVRLGRWGAGPAAPRWGMTHVVG
jgi:hypothetical protein